MRMMPSVLVRQLDRWGRRISDSINSIQELARLGVRFIAVTQTSTRMSRTPWLGSCFIRMGASLFRQHRGEFSGRDGLVIGTATETGTGTRRLRGAWLAKLPPSRHALSGGLWFVIAERSRFSLCACRSDGTIRPRPTGGTSSHAVALPAYDNPPLDRLTAPCDRRISSTVSQPMSFLRYASFITQ